MFIQLSIGIFDKYTALCNLSAKAFLPIISFLQATSLRIQQCLAAVGSNMLVQGSSVLFLFVVQLLLWQVSVGSMH